MKTKVLISGAGPSGLSAALFLASRGRKVMIIDKNAGRTDKSKAIGVQPGTLELLEKCFGPRMPAEMVSSGIPAKEFFFHTDNGKVFPVKFSDVPSKYNSLLMLRQSETERIFEEHLAAHGVRVLRGHELTGMKQENSAVICEVKTAQGPLAVEAGYLIGCDGAHSAVRHLLKYDFEGGAYDGDFALGDLRVDWKWDHGTIRTFLGEKGGAAFFPLKGEKQYRLILIPRAQSQQQGEKPPLDLEQFRIEAAAYVPNESIKLSEPQWLTRFRVHHRMAPKMGEGRVFICGDAAHIHSPVGAQGMNTGIHDSIDLCRRITEILEGKSDEKLLHGFLQDRHENGDRVVKFTDFVFKRMFAPESVFTRTMRRRIMPVVMTTGFIQRRLLRLVSEIDVARGIAAEIKPSAAKSPRPSDAEL